MQNSRGLLPTIQRLDSLASRRIVERGLKDLGLTRSVLEGPPVHLPLRLHAGLLEHVARTIGEEHLGAILAKGFSFASLAGANSYSNYVLGASRLDLALQRTMRALPFLQRGTNIRTRRDGQHLVVSYDTPLGGGIAVQLLEQELPPVLTGFVRPFLGPDWVPDWIELPQTHRLQARALERVLGTEVRSGDMLPGIAIPLSRINAPSLLDDAARLEITASGVRELRFLRPPRTRSDAVRQALRMQLNKGSASVNDVAEALGVGVRTLQRQLLAEGGSFKDLAQSEQIGRAKMLLAETDMSVAQVAYYLGFTEVNSFRRAFRSWFGATPSQFRSSSSG